MRNFPPSDVSTFLEILTVIAKTSLRSKTQSFLLASVKPSYLHTSAIFPAHPNHYSTHSPTNSLSQWHHTPPSSSPPQPKPSKQSATSNGTSNAPKTRPPNSQTSTTRSNPSACESARSKISKKSSGSPSGKRYPFTPKRLSTQSRRFAETWTRASGSSARTARCRCYEKE